MKKNKKIKYETEEQKEVKKFIFVVIGLVIIIVGIYFFTKAFVTKDLFDKSKDNYTEGVINYDSVIIGNMLNRPYDEYYLLAFSSENLQQNYYEALMNKYKSKEKSLKIFKIDLNNELNKKYVAEEKGKISSKFESLENLKLGEITLIKVKNKKVIKFITNIDDIVKELTA